MRSWCVVVGLLLSAPAQADDGPPAFEDALAKAGATGKPLVIELTMIGCRPCEVFEQKVLPRADVQAALANVIFVRYDIETTAGEDVSARFGISGFPTFLIVDAAGHVVAKQEGMVLDAAAGAAHFISWLHWAPYDGENTETLERAVAEHPDDLTARLRLAHHYRALGRVDAATAQYSSVIEHEGADRTLVARATAERDDMTRAEERLATEVTSDIEFVTKFPDSELATFRLAILAISGRVPRADLALMLEAHLAAVSKERWPYAVRVALIANEVGIARQSVEQHLAAAPRDRAVHLMHSELLVFVGDQAQAMREIEATCGDEDTALWCFLLKQAYARKTSTTSSTRQLRHRAETYVQSLARPAAAETDDDGNDALLGAGGAFGNTVGRALDKAERTCGDEHPRGGVVAIGFELPAMRGLPRVRTVARDKALAGCVKTVLEREPLPPAPASFDGRLITSLYVAARVDERREAETRRRLRGPHRGIAAGPAARFGEVQTYGFAARFAVAGRPLFQNFDLAAGGEVELAAGDTGAPVYAARGLLGLHTWLFGSHVEGYVLAGVGISDLGKRSPFAFDFPIEERVIVPAGPLRVHAWIDAFDLFRAGFHGGYGVGLSVPFGDVRMLFGAEYETRTMGDSVQFTIGFPVGNLY